MSKAVFPKELMIFRHWKKGDMYQVLHVALDSETMGGVVVYRNVTHGKPQTVWVRTLESWMSPVDKRTALEKIRDFLLRRRCAGGVRFIPMFSVTPENASRHERAVAALRQKLENT